MSTHAQPTPAPVVAAPPLTVTVTQQSEQPTATSDHATTTVSVDRIVDETLIESFPASDPPSWWAGTR